MNEKQQKLYDALKEYNVTVDQAMINEDQKWSQVVNTFTEYARAIQNKEEYYDAGFPPEIEREMDQGALRTGWMYRTLECASKQRIDTNKRIRKALGYNR